MWRRWEAENRARQGPRSWPQWDELMLSDESNLRRILVVPLAFEQVRTLKSMNDDWCGADVELSNASISQIRQRVACWTLEWRMQQRISWFVYWSPSARPYQLLGLALIVGVAVHLHREEQARALPRG